MELGAVAASVMKAPVVEFFTWTMTGTDDPALNVAPAFGLTNTAEVLLKRAFEVAGLVVDAAGATVAPRGLESSQRKRNRDGRVDRRLPRVVVHGVVRIEVRYLRACTCGEAQRRGHSSSELPKVAGAEVVDIQASCAVETQADRVSKPGREHCKACAACLKFEDVASLQTSDRRRNA